MTLYYSFCPVTCGIIHVVLLVQNVRVVSDLLHSHCVLGQLCTVSYRTTLVHLSENHVDMYEIL